MFEKLVLCKLSPEYCPSVETLPDGRVRIGEEPNVAFLTKEQWNMFVAAVETKRLGAL